MRFSLVTTFAAAMLLAACSTPSEEASTTSGSGSSGSTTSSSTDAGTSQSGLPGPAAGTQEELTVEVGDRVFFDFDQYNIRADQRGTVEALAAWLDSNPGATLTLEGHADERGTREYNLALGERRANSVRDYLIALGSNPGRLSVVSFGEERPAVLGSNDSAWAQNRRSAFVVN
ncbi:peptidoglycan-associated lipoprotein Pal [Pelagibius litoralis]|uniref:Peptidoglycan-associated lipoprotein n=1 Tax=Pelagibius litoralis TaxID=374515 RepID=A0A967EZZ7_9PROT|nr:peptidoglycan-associated lipoprotein Pal [Pelagibius litoralis]